MYEMLIDILSWASFLVGGFFLFVGSLGMVRLVDFWARLHAASIIDSAGIGLIIFGIRMALKAILFPKACRQMVLNWLMI